MIKRLFLALNLPKNIISELEPILIKLQKANKNKPIKWVEPQNLHLTLHFLGNVAEEKIEAIKQSLEPIISQFESLNYQVTTEIEAFPDLQNPRVIFLKLIELNEQQTQKLQKAIGIELEKIGFDLDKRLFRLHLTLGRVKFKTSISIPNFIIHNSEFRINSVDLMESQLNQQGPIYQIIRQFNLKD